MSKSSVAVPEMAMVLAAGRGERLRPLTDQLPKPLVQVAGRSLIDRVLDRLVKAGVKRAVVNLHYKAEMLRAHLEKRERREPPSLIFIEEEELLDTGGGVANALSHFDKKPFYVINSDIIWRDAMEDSLLQLARRWDGKRMDILLLIQPTVTAFGYDGSGDFIMAPNGLLVRRPERQVAPFLYAGVQIVHPRVFDDCPKGPFSFNLLYDRAAEAGRLHGIRHEGDWIHIGSLEGLEAAQRELEQARVRA